MMTKRQDSNEKDILNMEQAIALLKTSQPTFYRWLREGRIRGMKVGRQWRFYKEDIEDFMRGDSRKVDLPADINPLLETLVARIRETESEYNPDGRRNLLEQAFDLMVHLVHLVRDVLAVAEVADESHIRRPAVVLDH